MRALVLVAAAALALSACDNGTNLSGIDANEAAAVDNSVIDADGVSENSVGSEDGQVVILPVTEEGEVRPREVSENS